MIRLIKRANVLGSVPSQIGEVSYVERNGPLSLQQKLLMAKVFIRQELGEILLSPPSGSKISPELPCTVLGPSC